MVRAINRAHSYSLTKMGPHWINGVATYAYAIADPVTGEQAARGAARSPRTHWSSTPPQASAGTSLIQPLHRACRRACLCHLRCGQRRVHGHRPWKRVGLRLCHSE
jgi:hypothetical protein